MDALEIAFLLEVKGLLQLLHLARKEKQRFFLGISLQFQQTQLLYFSWKQGQYAKILL